MLNTKSDNSNYLARVVKIENIRKHSNADRLMCSTILSNNIIIGLDNKIGDIGIYFPLESIINKDFLSWSNAFQEKELNKNSEIKGLFNKYGRVRCVKLRGERSEGFFLPVKDIEKWLKDIGKFYSFTDKDINQDFDSIYDILLVEKYVNQIALRQQQLQLDREARRNLKKIKRTSKIIDNQFRLAEDTLHLKKLVGQISPEDYITIGYKLHGCNISIGKVLCKKQLKWYERLLKKMGIQIIDSQYDLIWASRRCIKNEFADQKTQDYYEEDIWGKTARRIKDLLKDGISFHGEVVGQLSTGSWIQKDYDYGTAPQQSELYIYRMFYTNPTGDVFEFSTPQMIKYCQKVGLKTVPIFYYGLAKNKYPELNIENHWHENFLNKLIEEYTEKDCYLCKNKVPAEGIVVAKNDDYFIAWKLKSFQFLERETKELDKEEVNIEDCN